MMTGPALAGKMKRKPWIRAATIDKPPDCQTASFAGMGHAASSLTGTYDRIQTFVKKETELRTLISVNETWSAFALRPYEPGESHTRARN